MYKIVLDADGLIKLAKSGLLNKLPQLAKCHISKQVYTEAVERGKEKMYEDAYAIDALIHSGEIDVISMKTNIIDSSLSSGEILSLELYKKLKADAIISDDRRFLNLLNQEKCEYIIPADIIVILAKSRKVTKEEAINGLNKIRTLVREDVYLSALKRLGGE